MQRAQTDLNFQIENGLCIIGSPETVRRKLEAGKEQIGYDIFCTAFPGGGRMPKDKIQKSIELFGREVIPGFR
jgi:alkanesulfonate monooxygenase SsuD/methylene tetrahydromethanopterin reductase-like flavin-dependent oxidoreductase (luciferase family)